MSDRKERLVVHIPRRLTHSSWGGTERVLEQTLPLLKEHHFQASVFTSQALDTGIVDQLGDTPVTRFPYFYPEFPLSEARKLRFDNKGGNTFSPALTRSLAEVENLALVHFHTGNLLAAHCLKVAKKRNVPTVLTLHGGHFAIPEAELKNLTGSSEQAPRRGIPLGRVLSIALGARNILEKIDALVCVGLDEYEAARSALPNQKVIFLPGGVNIEEFSQADRTRGRELLGVEPNRKLIGCIARVDEQKDQATLVRAWAKHMSQDCDLAIVGPETSPGYSEQLRALADGARGKLLLPGGMPPKEAAHLYAALDVSVLPSRHEPFGLTCLESWAAKTPLIAANRGGPGWLLSGEKEGRLFEVGDHGRLGELLDELLTDTAQRQRLISAAYDRVQAEFTWKKRAEKLSSLYEELLSSR